MKKLLLFAFLIFNFFYCKGQGNPANALTEFEEFTNDSSNAVISSTAGSTLHKKSPPATIYWTAAVLLFAAVAGVLASFKHTRQLRSVFLVLSVVILGFYRGGCPCSIQSFQNAILLAAGSLIRWPSVLLFTGLVLITYFFGRVYCGWICQLGALQELIFKTSSFRLFQSKRSQRILRGMRITALIALLTQLLITKTNLYQTIDPFSFIYNFYSEYLTGWILVAVIIISSFYIYRPFCKTICPVGLVLGWIGKLPGASVIGIKQNCTSCIVCASKCSIRAITHDQKISRLDNQECIRCGECLNACKKNALTIYRRSEQHPSKIECKAYS